MNVAIVVWAVVATVWATAATVLIFYNPLPFPDRGHRIFGVRDERARSVVVKLIEMFTGKQSRYTFDSADVHQTIMGDGFTSILYLDNNQIGIPASGISIPVNDPLEAANKAVELLQNKGYTAEIIESVKFDLPPNQLVPIKSNAFDGWTLIFRRSLVKMPRPEFRTGDFQNFRANFWHDTD
jgi:hypothetical protein